MSWTQSRTVRWAAGAVLLCLLMVIVSWFALIGPRRSQAAELHDSALSALQGNEVLRARIEELRVQYGKLPEQRAKLEEIRRQLPAGDDLSALLRSVDSLATASGVSLTSLSPGTVAVASGGVQSIPLSMEVSGDYFQAVAFLRQLQTGMPRAVLVTGLQIAQGNGGSKVQVTITGQVFTRPDSGTTTTASGSSGTAGLSGTAGSSGTAGTSTSGTVPPSVTASPSGTASPTAPVSPSTPAGAATTRSVPVALSTDPAAGRSRW